MCTAVAFTYTLAFRMVLILSEHWILQFQSVRTRNSLVALFIHSSASSRMVVIDVYNKVSYVLSGQLQVITLYKAAVPKMNINQDSIWMVAIASP